MSSVVSVRMNDSEAEILNNAAAFYGCAVSSLLKKLAIEKLEDEYDLSIIRDYEEDKKRGLVKTKPIKELFDELGV